jgi:hypothetical protein
MSSRGASSRRAIEKMARETEIADERETPEAGVPEETGTAEEPGAERLRARLREMLEERRRVVRVGEQQIEVVEVTAVEDVLAEDSEENG